MKTPSHRKQIEIDWEPGRKFVYDQILEPESGITPAHTNDDVVDLD